MGVLLIVVWWGCAVAAEYAASTLGARPTLAVAVALAVLCLIPAVVVWVEQRRSSRQVDEFLARLDREWRDD
jgi:Flp pilus assembly protein TadB